MRRNELLIQTGQTVPAFRALQRSGNLFFLTEVEERGWLDVPPLYAFLLCVQIELGKHIEMCAASTRVVDFDFATIEKAAPFITRSSELGAEAWLLSGEIELSGSTTGPYSIDLTLPVSAVGLLDGMADRPVAHRKVRGWQAGKVRDIEGAMTSAVLLNLSSIWRAMNARARAAGLDRDLVWGGGAAPQT